MLRVPILQYFLFTRKYCSLVSRPRSWQSTLSELREQIMKGKGCLSHQINFLNAHILEGNLLSPTDSTLLMKACAADMIDVPGISDQKSITISTWETIKKMTPVDGRSQILYSTALEAFIFQENEINEDSFLSEMMETCAPDESTYENLIIYKSRAGKLSEALDLAEAFSIWSHEVVLELIAAHTSRGDLALAKEILDTLDIEEGELSLPHAEKENLPLRLRIAGAFLVGAARSGDCDRVKLYLQKYTHGTKEMLSALVELCRSSPENYTLILDEIPGDKERPAYKQWFCQQFAEKSLYLVDSPKPQGGRIQHQLQPVPSLPSYTNDKKDRLGHVIHLSKLVRRPVKHLLQLNLETVALQLVTRSFEFKNILSLSSMRVRSPVLVLEHFLDRQDNVDLVWDVIEQLVKCDNYIKEKSICLIYNALWSNPQRKQFCQDLARRMDDKWQSNVTHMFLNKMIKDKIEVVENDAELINLIKISSELGLRLNHLPVWNTVVYKLLPNTSPSYQPDVKSLVARVFEVKGELDCLISKEKGFYSNTVIWGHIFQSLLHRESDLFMTTASVLCRRLGVVYASSKWNINLGKSLYTTKLVSSYVDILKVAHDALNKNQKFRENFFAVCDSILVTIDRAAEDGVIIDDELGEIISLAWNSGILLPQAVKEKVCLSMVDRDLANSILAIPSLEESELAVGGHKVTNSRSANHQRGIKR